MAGVTTYASVPNMTDIGNMEITLGGQPRHRM